MPRNEEGEFELVVGNKQLLSIVFILFVLFGIVFSMGYFVGRDSAPEPSPVRQTAGTPSQPRPAPASEPVALPVAPQAQTQPAADPGLQPGEAKVAAATTPPTESNAEPPSAAQPAPEASPPANPQPVPAAPAPDPAASGLPQRGQVFLQVAAVKRPEAELIVDVLKKRGFRAVVAPVVVGQPEDALWRALVGPLRDAADVAKARADLHSAGFKEVIVRKY